MMVNNKRKKVQMTEEQAAYIITTNVRKWLDAKRLIK